MVDPQPAQEQNHPLYSIDRDHVDRLLAKNAPEDEDIVDLARLLLRYEDFPGALDLQSDMVKTLELWGLTRERLNALARQIWSNGYRPGRNLEDGVGSGFDTADDESK